MGYTQLRLRGSIGLSRAGELLEGPASVPPMPAPVPMGILSSLSRGGWRAAGRVSVNGTHLWCSSPSCSGMVWLKAAAPIAVSLVVCACVVFCSFRSASLCYDSFCYDTACV